MPKYTIVCNKCKTVKNVVLPMSEVSKLKDMTSECCGVNMTRDYSGIILYSDNNIWDDNSVNSWKHGKTITDVAGVFAGTIDP